MESSKKRCSVMAGLVGQEIPVGSILKFREGFNSGSYRDLETVEVTRVGLTRHVDSIRDINNRIERGQYRLVYFIVGGVERSCYEGRLEFDNPIKEYRIDQEPFEDEDLL